MASSGRVLVPLLGAAAAAVVATLVVASASIAPPSTNNVLPPKAPIGGRVQQQWVHKRQSSWPSSSSSTPAKRSLATSRVCCQVRSSQLHGPVSNAQAADLVERILAVASAAGADAAASDEDKACPLRRPVFDRRKPYVSWRPGNKVIGRVADDDDDAKDDDDAILQLGQQQREQICADHPDFCDKLYPANESDRVAQLIYDHQNPRDCAQARFLVLTKEWHSGLGSNIHVKAWMLLVAMMAKRVLIDSPDIAWYMTNPANCPQQDWSCYFAPVSRCSLPEDWDEGKAPEFDVSDLTADTTKTKRQYVRAQAHPQPLNGALVMGHLDAQRLEGFGGGGGDGGSSEYAKKPNSWWMTHATVYLLRPNERTIDVACWYWRCMSVPNNGQLHDRQQPHLTASIFVRSGDKWKEANLRTAREHFDALDAFVRSNPALRPNLVYFGTDDALVLSDAARQYSDKWNLTWIGYHREARGLTFEEFKTRYRSAKVEWQVLASLADLYISVLGDLFVGSLSSNWCRLTDEFRKAHGKAGLPYLTPEGEALVAGV